MKRSSKQTRVVKTFSFGLVLVLLLGVFVGCGGDTTPPAVTTGGNQATNDPQGTTPPENQFDPESAPIPYLEDFDGYQFDVLSRNANTTYWAGNDICGELTGNILDQAVYSRNEIVTNQYNFDIVEHQADEWVDLARNTWMTGGEEAFDMWAFKMNDLPSLGQEGMLWNLNEVKNIRLDAAYYDQGLQEPSSFANYLFFVTGDMVYMDEMATECIVFSHDLANHFNITETLGKTLYQVVDDGEWTIEKFTELVRMTTADKDGNDNMDETDYWGFCWENANILGFNIGMGNALLKKDASDVFVFDYDEKLVNDLESIINLLNAGYSVGRDWTEDRFDKGNQFCTVRGVKYLADFTSYGLNFGVLPFFKADTDQKNYYSFISTYGSNSINITTTVEDVELVASIIELISYQSRKTVSPVINEYLFGGRIIAHPEDVRMLELVYAGKTYELCYLWSTGSLYSTMIALNDAGSPGIASSLEACKDAVAASVTRKLERLENLG
ncbi:MAG: hypothetical protein E7620_02695 [Ruminococcaceae bacterium]|nr:hypothetical protein [Oscillospiraceae bacterium]